MIKIAKIIKLLFINNSKLKVHIWTLEAGRRFKLEKLETKFS